MPTTPSSGVPPSQGRVLVVDDSALVRTIVQRYLTTAGYQVEEAENGAVALRLLESGTFDVAITDLRMPEIDGFGVLEGVKARGLATEVIILTGMHANDVDAAIRCLRLGAHDFLTKPPSGPDEVVVTVERAIEKKRLREANLRLVRELEELTRTDSLTGALNRRAFDETLRREAARARRYSYPLCLAIFDLDHFKKINDRHGHPAGDAVIKAFVRLAEMIFRESDSVYRYGGEEFAILLPHTAIEGGVDAAQRLVTVIAETPVRVEENLLKVTVSAGVAALNAEGDIGDLVSRADASLYEAKKNGRNRVSGPRQLRLVKHPRT